VTTATPALPTWDLSDLYAGVDDPRLEQDLAALDERARAFETRYKGTLAHEALKAAQLKTALDDYEALSRALYKPAAYAQLLFSTNTKDPQRGALLQRTQEAISRVSTHLVFFELELGKIPAGRYAGVIGDEALCTYRHFLDKKRLEAQHHLSEAEEKILVETANSRGPAFARLSTEINARTSFVLTRDGEEQHLSQSEILALLYDPDRTLRQEAAAAFTAGIKQNEHVSTFIYNTLIHEKDVIDRLRGYSTPESARHLDNEISQAVVDTMVQVCVDNYPTVARYYELKKKLLGLDELLHYDRYAPLSAEQSHVPFSEAKDVILEAYGNFSPRMAKMVEPFFEQRWIDAELSEGKSGGAYCAGVTPDLHPYVLMNYTHTPRDVMTLAHELGHGVHDVLASTHHLFDYHPVLPLAETASTFGEMLVFDHVLSRLDSQAEKLALVCGKIEDTFATVFRQVAMFRFERRAQQVRRDKGEQPTESYNALWQTTQQEMFGDALTLGPEHASWWLYIPHVVQVPFYVYAYAFGELLVLALYAQYRQQGETFVERYFNLLAAGGSKSPETLISEMGFDINDRAFWQSGCDLIAERVATAEALAA